MSQGGTASIFITGSSGLIGRHLVQILAKKENTKLYCLQRNPPEIADPQVHMVRGDLCNPQSYRKYLEGCESVIHLAALTEQASEEQYDRVNRQGTKELVEASVQQGIRKFLHISTIAVKYPHKKNYPYALSKESAEIVVRESDLRYTIVRPTIVLDRESKIWKKLSALVRNRVLFLPGEGSVRIQPIHVQDLVRCLVTVLEQDLFTEQIYEIGGRETMTMREFLFMIYRSKHSAKPLVVKLPLKQISALLQFVENYTNFILPVGSGQLSAFFHDGSIALNSLFDSCRTSMMTTGEMLATLNSSVTT